MAMHEFTLELTGLELTDELANEVYEAGFTDVSLAFNGGVLKMIFGRESDETELRVVADAVYDVTMKIGYESVKIRETKTLTPKDINVLESFILFSDMAQPEEAKCPTPKN